MKIKVQLNETQQKMLSTSTQHRKLGSSADGSLFSHQNSSDWLRKWSMAKSTMKLRKSEGFVRFDTQHWNTYY